MEDEPALGLKLLSSSMAQLAPIAEAPVVGNGRPLLAGLFAVKHKPHCDRLIFDRRPKTRESRGCSGRDCLAARSSAGLV